MLMQRYGREFALAASENRDSCVSERVRLILFLLMRSSHIAISYSQVANKLKFKTPTADLVDAYCKVIAEGYGVPWVDANSPDEASSDDGGGGGALVVQHIPLSTVSSSLTDLRSTAQELARQNGLESPLPVPLVETPFKLPDLPSADAKDTKEAPPKAKSPKADEEDELAALTKRFEALRKR